MTRTVYYVLSNQGSWRVTRESADRTLRVFDRKVDAIEYARNVARNNKPSMVRVQRADGTWEDEWTYGDDPFPPRG